MLLYWPTTGLALGTGKLIGWKLSGAACVVAIVNDKDDFLQSKYTQLPETFHVPKLELLGSAHHDASRDSMTASAHEDDGLKVWIDHRARPYACSTSAQIILYTPPDSKRLRFLALRGPRGSISKAGDELAKQDAYAIGARGASDSMGLDDVLPLINCAQEVQRRIGQKNPSTIARQTGELGVPSRRLNGLLDSALLGLISLREGARNFVPIFSMDIANAGSLRSWSSAVDQLCLRLCQMLDAPDDLSKTRPRDRDGPEIPLMVRSEQYMRFWNTVWLIINDLILGHCGYQVIGQIAPLTTELLSAAFQTYLIEFITAALRWLNDWPVGLKLNTPLSQFFSTSLSLVVERWSNLLNPLIVSYTPTFIDLLAWSSRAGFTLLLAVISDLFKLLALHLTICSYITSLMFRWQLDSLGSLFNLFRGKRWNVLRERTDTYEYDVDQLFLGTLLFTVSAFLFPTVLTYATLFTFISTTLKAVSRGIGLVINSFNGFPLFEIMLSIKEPSRLPAGVFFELIPAVVPPRPTPGHCISYTLELKNSPKFFIDILRRRNGVQTT